MTDPNCIFCHIASGQSPCFEVWSDENHMAFLSIFPNTEGFTVVIPKKHYGSYAFAQADEVLQDLIVATKKVAQILDNYFQDVARCGMFFEGYGVDHLHSKLFPMHGTGSTTDFAQIESQTFNQYFDKYPGYLCSNNSDRADDKALLDLAQKIRNSTNPSSQ